MEGGGAGAGPGTLAWVVAICLCGHSGLAAAPPAQPDAAQIHYFKQPIPLVPRHGQLAVFAPQIDSPQLQRALETSGHAPRSVSRRGLPGWHSVQFDPTGRGAAQDAQTLDSVTKLGWFGSAVYATPEGGDLVVPREVLVRFAPTVNRAAAVDVMRQAGVDQILESDFAGLPGAYRARANGASNGARVLEIANALAQRPDVLFAEPDAIISGYANLQPDDPGFVNCWGLHNTGQSGGTPDMDMDALEAWDITIGSPSVIVLVIDVGVDLAHPDLPVYAGTDFTGATPANGGPQHPCDSHGTAVAGCVRASINNGIGTVGVAPNVRLASARCFVATDACDGSWITTYSWTATALAWGQSIGARVTNNSNSYAVPSAVISDKYDQTYAAGMIHFSSSGNNNASTVSYPASLPSLNAVGSVNRWGARSPFSNFGIALDLMGPGEGIYTTDRAGADGYNSTDNVTISGTSFAAPYAAGVAALVLSRNPGLAPADIELSIRSTALDLWNPGWDNRYGWGLVNARNALNAVPFGCNDIDFNNDGVSPDMRDLTDYLSVLEGAPCPAGYDCDTIDFNNDGVFPDNSDTTTFLRVFAGGPC